MTAVLCLLLAACGTPSRQASDHGAVEAPPEKRSFDLSAEPRSELDTVQRSPSEPAPKVPTEASPARGNTPNGAKQRGGVELAAALGDPLALKQLGRKAEPTTYFIRRWVRRGTQALKANHRSDLLRVYHVRIAIAAAWLAWFPTAPPLANACIKAAETWVLCPCPRHLRAVREARQALKPRYEQGALLGFPEDCAVQAAWLAVWAIDQNPIDAAHAAETAAEMPNVFFHSAPEVQSALRRAVVPWVLGKGEPIQERVMRGSDWRRPAHLEWDEDLESLLDREVHSESRRHKRNE